MDLTNWSPYIGAQGAKGFLELFFWDVTARFRRLSLLLGCAAILGYRSLASLSQHSATDSTPLTTTALMLGRVRSLTLVFLLLTVGIAVILVLIDVSKVILWAPGAQWMYGTHRMGDSPSYLTRLISRSSVSCSNERRARDSRILSCRACPSLINARSA